MLKIIKYRQTIKAFIQEYGREPDDEELSQRLNMTTAQIKRLKEYVEKEKVLSLNVPINTMDGAETFSDIIPDTENHYEELTDKIDADIKRQVVWDEVDHMKENESQILRMYYLDEKPLAYIGRVHGCSAENIRQIRDKALTKLKRNSKIKHYANEYLIAGAYGKVGLATFQRTHTSATERAAIDALDRTIKSHVRAVEKKVNHH